MLVFEYEFSFRDVCSSVMYSIAKTNESIKPWKIGVLPVASDFRVAQFLSVIIHPIGVEKQLDCWLLHDGDNRYWLLSWTF